MFRRDMLHDILIHPDFQVLKDKRQAVINMNLERANMKQVDHPYQINDWVLQIQHAPDKLYERAIGPYQVTQVFQNRMLRINKNGVHVDLNSRWFKPYNHR